MTFQFKNITSPIFLLLSLLLKAPGNATFVAVQFEREREHKVRRL